jgi:glutamate-ammonia-ligase adenylyltransferase
MRLRPSGNKGPIATSLASFRKYQSEEAWTWEHMALSRARIVAGDDALGREAEAVFADILARPRDLKKLAADVREMRELIEEEKPPRGVFDLKLIPGGVIDIEFVAQFLTLAAPAEGVDLKRRNTATLATLKALAPRLLGEGGAETLAEALNLYTEMSQLVRLCIDGDFEPAAAPTGLVDLVCKAADAPDIGALEARLEEVGAAVRKIFLMAVGATARSSRPNHGGDVGNAAGKR